MNSGKNPLYKLFLLILPLVPIGQEALAQITASKSKVILSAIKGTSSRPDTVILSIKGGTSKVATRIAGNQNKYFRIISSPQKISAGRNEPLILAFEPPVDFEGTAQATLQVRGMQSPIPLTGLSTKGLEGENEAPLQLITRTLGYSIDIGWESLANHLLPALQGDELGPSLFRKAGNSDVEMIPVARYSPDFLLNFGYYTPSAHGPVHHQTGILAKAGKHPEHQTLFPKLSAGGSRFDPGNSPFGFYAISPSHTVYSEDIWNILYHPDHATHAMRIYPVKDPGGAIVNNAYLVAMEEAANGDYNDYVFLVRNATAVPLERAFESLFNGTDLNGWYTWLATKGRNNDPDSIFTIEPGGILHDLGKELGYLMTENSYGNYHLVLEFRWGEKKWPPRENAKRDSGICYNVPEDEKDGIWPQSVECQIQEGDVGDFWLLGYSTIQVKGKQNPPLPHSQIVKAKDGEKPYGEWNTVEVISFNGKCAHVVNGVLVNHGENSSLVGGRILLQSEYAEVYYRRIRIRSL